MQPPMFPLRYRPQSILNDLQRTRKTFMLSPSLRVFNIASGSNAERCELPRLLPSSSAAEPCLQKQYLWWHYLHFNLFRISGISSNCDERQTIQGQATETGCSAVKPASTRSWRMCTSAQPLHLLTDKTCYFTKLRLDYAPHPKA